MNHRVKMWICYNKYSSYPINWFWHWLHDMWRCHICTYIASASLCCVCYGISRKNSVDVLWESNWNCV